MGGQGDQGGVHGARSQEHQLQHHGARQGRLKGGAALGPSPAIPRPSGALEMETCVFVCYKTRESWRDTYSWRACPRRPAAVPCISLISPRAVTCSVRLYGL